MSLRIGSRIGHYEVSGLLGQGGMGQVFRARDTRLQREVALKVLPDGFADDPERVARFEHEARALAALSHSGIAAIFGIEEADGVHALVLELVPGPTLEDRIAGGPIPLVEALRLAEGIAGAIEAAHEQGIVHRDLKPANIKIKDDGTVKVLDFGLAKALRPAGAESAAAVASDAATLDATRPGVILGTAAYMSPEQARAEPVDTRTDVWSFGCVLYEMLSGRRPFRGSSPPELLVAVLKEEPDFSALPAGTPPLVRRLLHRCLEKDRRQRLRHIGDARADLRDSLSPSGSTLAIGGAAGAEGGIAASPAAAPMRRRGLVAALAAAAALAAIGGWLLGSRGRGETPPPKVVSFQLATLHGPGAVAISPDGTHVFHTARGTHMLRDLARASVVERELPNVDAAFFSPDSRWVGFLTGFDSELWKVAVAGGAPAKVGKVGLDARKFGASWGTDDHIVVASSLGLHRVAASGGEPELLAEVDAARGELNFAAPEVLPGARTVLFSVVLRGTAQIAALDLESGERRTILAEGFGARYVPSGHLVYMAQLRPQVVAFDPVAVELRGEPVTLPEPKQLGSDFDVADDGTLVYVASDTGPSFAELEWIDREGREEPVGAPVEGGWIYPRISPDGRRFVGDRFLEGGRDLHVWDLARRTAIRLTDDPGEELFGVWSADGERIYFSSNRSGGPFNVYSRAADGSGGVELVCESPLTQMVSTLSPEGSELLVNQAGSGTFDIAAIDLASGRSRLLLATAAFEGMPSLSPDGKWMAYQSNVEGRYEVYVGPYPDVGSRRIRISTEGGDTPLWSRRGDEIFFRSATGAMMSAAVTLSPTFEVGAVTELFPSPVSGYEPGFGGRRFDVSPLDGRFLMLKLGSPVGTTSAMVVLGWGPQHGIGSPPGRSRE